MDRARWSFNQLNRPKIKMKNSPLKQALLLTAALTVLLGLGACQTSKNAGSGSKCEACSDCEKPAGPDAKKPSSK
jgi:hypothetical protein